MFSFKEFVKAKNKLHNDVFNVSPFLQESFKKSNFYLIDQEHTDLIEIEINFKEILLENDLIPLVFFYFIESPEDVITYFALYSNGIGIIYDLILGFDILADIFSRFFQNFVLFPNKKKDQINLSYFLDLSNNYFLNDPLITNVYQNDSLDKLLIHEKDLITRIMLKLIAYYSPLVGIVTGDFQLSPMNLNSQQNNQEMKLPEFDINDFIIISNRHEIMLYKKAFEFYSFKESNQYIDPLPKLYEKLYSKDDNQFIVPCFGIIPKSRTCLFLLKYVSGRKLSFNEIEDKVINDSRDVSISCIFYSMLACITIIHENGFYSPSMKDDSFIISYESGFIKCFYRDFHALFESTNTYVEELGVPKYMAYKTFTTGLCFPSFQVYSFAKILNHFVTQKVENFKYFVSKYDKMNIIFDECLKKVPEDDEIYEDENKILEDENKIPDSLLLFIQMYEENLFLPKAKRLFTDKIFHDFFKFILRSGATGGKYISSWSQVLKNNPFKNLILKYDSLTFKIFYSFTELEFNLKKMLKRDPFQLNYESSELFKINFFADKLDKQFIKNETDELINQFPKSYQTTMRLILYSELLESADDIESHLLNELFVQEKNDFAKYFEECICIANSLSLSPSFILTILNENDLHFRNSHDVIRYLLNTGASNCDIEECMAILSHFDDFLYQDVNELNKIFETNIFYDKLNAKIANKPLKLIFDEIGVQGGIIPLDAMALLSNSLKEIDEIKKEMNQMSNVLNKNSENIEKQKELTEMLNRAEQEQDEIDLLKSFFEIKRVA
ncbi:hypothetical protein M9Y10_033297 [Tritrichomonas musculus]|uniref:Protein kinase domain-containing protein n=1 Tax=Tritrichomonas musculus TaxID=1915356 RepID=A0ABR2KBS4_9EUKA